MLCLERYDRGPDLDPLGPRAHQGHGRQRVQVRGDLGHPGGVEARPLRPGHVVDHPCDLARGVPTLRPDHHTDPHSASQFSRFRGTGVPGFRCFEVPIFRVAGLPRRPAAAGQGRGRGGDDRRQGTHLRHDGVEGVPVGRPPPHPPPSCGARRPAGWSRPRRRRCPRPRRPAALHDPRRQRQVRAGENAEADHGHVLLERGRHDGVDALTDAGEDHLEAGVPQRPRDDLGPRSWPSRPGLAMSTRDDIRTPPVAGTRPRPP